jgi:hypothetical protein
MVLPYGTLGSLSFGTPHTHTVGLLWTGDQPEAETVHVSTQRFHETDTCDPGRIRTRRPSKRATADPRLNPRGHWDRCSTTFYWSKFYSNSLPIPYGTSVLPLYIFLTTCRKKYNNIWLDVCHFFPAGRHLILLSSYRHIIVGVKYNHRCKTKHGKLNVLKWRNSLTLASVAHGSQNDHSTQVVVLWAVTSCCILTDRQHDVLIRKAKTLSLLCGPHTLRLSFAMVKGFLFWSPILGLRPIIRYSTRYFQSFSYQFVYRYLEAKKNSFLQQSSTFISATVSETFKAS